MPSQKWIGSYSCQQREPYNHGRRTQSNILGKETIPKPDAGGEVDDQHRWYMDEDIQQAVVARLRKIPHPDPPLDTALLLLQDL